VIGFPIFAVHHLLESRVQVSGVEPESKKLDADLRSRA